MFRTQMMRSASYLLPDPGGEVVRSCLDEIERLQALERELTELRDVVRWERECQLVRHYVIFEALETCALREITRSISAARAEVDRLLEEK